MNSLAHTLSSRSPKPNRGIAQRLSIALWTPPHRRWADAMGALATRLYDALRDGVERRAQARLARRQQAALASLDARTLRDIGLGDWMAATPTSNDDTGRLQRELMLR